MTTSRRYIALVRGINVGGKNKLPMARLREMCESIGCTDVVTYIQSGNVVLTSSLAADNLRAALAAAISDGIGLSPEVMVRTDAQMANVIADSPFQRTDPTTLHVAFLSGPLDRKAADDLHDIAFPPEKFAIKGSEIYLRLPNGMGQSKLAPVLLRRVPGSATLRNWRTVTTLHEMSRVRERRRQ